MKTLLQSLEELGVPIARIVEQPICDDNGEILAWNFFVQNKSNVSIAGGTHKSREIAKKIAIAEAFERALTKKISARDDLAKEFLLDKYPTSCGFACGYDSASTGMRALREAVERWAWSMWIDRFFYLDQQHQNSFIISPVANSIFGKFEKVRLFKKDNIIVHHGSEQFVYSFLVLLLETPMGVFAGCRAGTNEEDLITHAAIEAFRNYRNATIVFNNPHIDGGSLVSRRSVYFASNKNAALCQIANASKNEWPEAIIEIWKEFHTGISGVYMWRCLMKNFIGWHLGDETRFVY